MVSLMYSFCFWQYSTLATSCMKTMLTPSPFPPVLEYNELRFQQNIIVIHFERESSRNCSESIVRGTYCSWVKPTVALQEVHFYCPSLTSKRGQWKLNFLLLKKPLNVLFVFSMYGYVKLLNTLYALYQSTFNRLRGRRNPSSVHSICVFSQPWLLVLIGVLFPTQPQPQPRCWSHWWSVRDATLHDIWDSINKVELQ